MKQITKFFALSFIMLAFSAATFAQVSATATASAVIVGPIGITNTVNMNFGNVAVTTALGTVVLDPAGARTVTGGCTLPAITGGPTAASFTVSGAANYTYDITLPVAATLISGPGPDMSVDTWTSNPSGTGTIGAGGTEILTVGATLHVAGSQTAGSYTSATPFTVTVNYN